MVLVLPGTGKSSLVCALCIGMAGSPKLVNLKDGSPASNAWASFWGAGLILIDVGMPPWSTATATGVLQRFVVAIRGRAQTTQNFSNSLSLHDHSSALSTWPMLHAKSP
eukprot:scaffold265206_cov14-Tisochrysis_lutea.AAC.1